jgi:hypothetical protein
MSGLHTYTHHQIIEGLTETPNSKLEEHTNPTNHERTLLYTLKKSSSASSLEGNKALTLPGCGHARQRPQHLQRGIRHTRSPPSMVPSLGWFPPKSMERETPTIASNEDYEATLRRHQHRSHPFETTRKTANNGGGHLAAWPAPWPRRRRPEEPAQNPPLHPRLQGSTTFRKYLLLKNIKILLYKLFNLLNLYSVEASKKPLSKLLQNIVYHHRAKRDLLLYPC